MIFALFALNACLSMYWLYKLAYQKANILYAVLFSISLFASVINVLQIVSKS